MLRRIGFAALASWALLVSLPAVAVSFVIGGTVYAADWLREEWRTLKESFQGPPEGPRYRA